MMLASVQCSHVRCAGHVDELKSHDVLWTLQWCPPLEVDRPKKLGKLWWAERSSYKYHIADFAHLPFPSGIL